MSETKFIDLDAVDLPVHLEVKLGGRKHALVPVTLDNFIANTKALQELGRSDGDFEKEAAIIKGVILRAFPTMTEADLGGMALANLNKLMAVAQEQDGTDTVKQAAEQDAKANPPQAAA